MRRIAPSVDVWFAGVVCIAGCGRIGFDPIADRPALSFDDAGIAASGGGSSMVVIDSGSPGGNGAAGGGNAGGGDAGAGGNAGGGTNGNGGVIGASGATGAGSSGAGGATASGGVSASGGAAAPGGSPGSGGATASGGSPGSGGATATGCTTSSTCTCASFAGHAYRFCAATDAVTAQAECVSAGMRLARVDDAKENTWLRSTADSVVGGLDLYVGAQDPTSQSTWQWPDGAVFWTGDDSGAAQNGLYANWMVASKRPTGSAVRTCALIASASQWTPAQAGYWYDSGCGLVRPYVCEAY